MTEETSPDWLPAGWTRQFKFQKTGRRITHYENLATGQKFFTKDDLIRHTKTGIARCDDQQPTLNQIKMPSANGHMNTAAKANERPDWLPKNWLMELKTQKSGSNIGRRYKIYVDPSTGSRFYSKPEVFGFLKNVEQKSSKSKPKKRASPSTSEIAVKSNERPEWLPKDWFMEVKTHKGGAKVGKHSKIYIDPLTGFRFYSKPEVFRFLNHAGQKSSKSKQKKSASCFTSKFVIRRPTVKDLPAGWIKEIKIRRTVNGVRRDPYYTDQASGCVFRSKKAVLRYLETGEMRRDAFLPKKHSDDQNLIDKDKSQLPAAKRLKVKHPATRRQLFTGEETSDGSILSDLEAETFEKGQSKKDYTETGLATVSADNVLVSTAAADVLQMKNLLESGTERRSNINAKNSGNSKNKTELDLPRGFSNRLARFEPELVATSLEPVKPCQNESF
ncbi:hypothetical protein REPUB_Repub08aG0184800 [Reevesia pubescens]